MSARAKDSLIFYPPEKVCVKLFKGSYSQQQSNNAYFIFFII